MIEIKSITNDMVALLLHLIDHHQRYIISGDRNFSYMMAEGSGEILVHAGDVTSGMICDHFARVLFKQRAYRGNNVHYDIKFIQLSSGTVWDALCLRIQPDGTRNRIEEPEIQDPQHLITLLPLLPPNKVKLNIELIHRLGGTPPVNLPSGQSAQVGYTSVSTSILNDLEL